MMFLWKTPEAKKFAEIPVLILQGISKNILLSYPGLISFFLRIFRPKAARIRVNGCWFRQNFKLLVVSIILCSVFCRFPVLNWPITNPNRLP
jgi:hypothetical protein